VVHSLVLMHALFPHPDRTARGMQRFTIIRHGLMAERPEKCVSGTDLSPTVSGNGLRDGYGSPARSWSIFTTTETRRLRGSLGSA
jgi:hypothetical protein